MKTKNLSRYLLKCTGVLVLIFGAAQLLELLFSLLCLFGFSAPSDTTMPDGLWAWILSFLSTLFNLSVGLLGIQYADRPGKALPCVILGAVLVLHVLINFLYYGPSFWFSTVPLFLTFLVSILLSAVYLFGAVLNLRLPPETAPDTEPTEPKA